jgi:hypothetical protein
MQLMESMSIRFEGGYFRLKTFRHERLADAVNYARVLRLRQDDLEASPAISAI